jgi:tripartite-type tricarboxylate transporter receptor subunit TctC
MRSTRWIVAALALFGGAAFAQQYPTKPVRIIVAFTPGSATDILARLTADSLTKSMGQPFIVENRAGAGGIIGTQAAKDAPADGYTLTACPSGPFGINPGIYSHLPYDPIKDFEPITLAATIPFCLTVNSSMPVHTLNEFIEYTKTAPHPLTYGTAGIGSPHHFSIELLRSMTGINVVHVPYKGSAGIIPALLSGEIDFTVAAVNSLLPYFKAGRLRPIAMAGSSRTAILPEVPTIAEAGPLPGYAVDVWLGVMAPAGTPRPIVDRLNGEINRIVRDPQIIKERLNTVGLEAVGSTPEQLMEVMKAELVKYTKVARDAHIQPE